jgi:hypothetical protein
MSRTASLSLLARPFLVVRQIYHKASAPLITQPILTPPTSCNISVTFPPLTRRLVSTFQHTTAASSPGRQSS